ncbi:hypothetical protein HDV00_005673 [Rhizophlyctis rosea]|nr:hypothetical protein HDV00_005673 [Rhizophlyctis rosea]
MSLIKSKDAIKLEDITFYWLGTECETNDSPVSSEVDDMGFMEAVPDTPLEEEAAPEKSMAYIGGHFVTVSYRLPPGQQVKFSAPIAELHRLRDGKYRGSLQMQVQAESGSQKLRVSPQEKSTTASVKPSTAAVEDAHERDKAPSKGERGCSDCRICASTREGGLDKESLILCAACREMLDNFEVLPLAELSPPYNDDAIDDAILDEGSLLLASQGSVAAEKIIQPSIANAPNNFQSTQNNDDLDDSDFAPVECILGCRIEFGQRHYLVKWEDNHETRWVHEEEMEDCDELIAEWENTKLQRPSTAKPSHSRSAIKSAETSASSSPASRSSGNEFDVKCILDSQTGAEGERSFLNSLPALESFWKLKAIPPVLKKYMNIHRKPSDRLSWPTATKTGPRITDDSLPGAFFATKKSKHPLTYRWVSHSWHIQPSLLPGAGLGLFTLYDIPAGSFIGVYEGHRHRGTKQNFKRKDGSIGVRTKPLSAQMQDRIFQIPGGGSLVPDGKNVLQYMNTSGVRVEGRGFFKIPQNNNVMWLFDGSYGWVPACYALRDIKAGEELLADYGDMYKL